MFRLMKEAQDTFLRDVEAVMDTVAGSTGFGSILTGLHERTILHRGPVTAFCSHCLEHPAIAPLCRYACRQATMQSLASGEPYFQRCWAGLFFTTVALAPENVCRGGLSIGGFYGAGEENDIQAAVRRQVAELPSGDRERFVRLLDTLVSVTPAALRGLGLFLMEAAISSGIDSNEFFRRQNEKYRQQRAIAEAFQDIRRQEQPTLDVLGDTYHFVNILRGGNRERAMEFISQYLARILAMSHWNLRNLKANARVLLAAIAGREIMDGMDWEIAVSRETQRMNRLMACRSTEDCCLEIADLVLGVSEQAEGYGPSGGAVSERVEQWIRRNYATGATLDKMARAVGASASSIVHELKKHTGKTSRQVRREVRVDEARKLLATTSLEIADIAGLCGFYDQSHFTRTFKSVVNLTPGRFRRLLRFTKEDV